MPDERGFEGSLTCDSLKKCFGRVVALDGVSASFQAGEITAIIGPNGSGKSTLLNVLTGFWLADAGSVRLSGLDITKAPAYRRARLGISRSFQDLRLPRQMTVGELLGFNAFAAEGSLFSSARRESVAPDVPASMGLAGLSEQRVGELSWGQQKLVSVACALSRISSGVVLLDEPCSGVSDQLLEQIARLISTSATSGRAIVFVEHNLRFVGEVSTRTVVMESGRVQASGDTRAVFSASNQLSVYLG